MSSSSLPSSVSCNLEYEVFPSFCREDIGTGFFSYFQKEFERKGIPLFTDRRRESFGPGVIEAIRRSRIAVVILSRNYASSTLCLDELVLIMKCKNELGQTVIPIFYEVEPVDLKKQSGYLEKVRAGTSQALKEVAQIHGYNSSKWENEAEMIERVAYDVSNMFYKSGPSRDFDRLVGMDNHMRQISSLLSVDTDDVRMVGILGPAGIGKTTIARALYRKLSDKFTHTAFMESIRGSRKNFQFELHVIGELLTPIFNQKYLKIDHLGYKLLLQERLLSQIFNRKDLKIDHLGVAEERLKDKKVLVVLDDVDDLRQLQAMAGKTQWFGPGSRIIITTKDTRPLKAHEIEHIYNVEFPCSSEALEIFCLSAFEQKSPKDGYKELTKEIIGLAGNLPLGLSVFGSYLRGMSKEEWIHALPRLRTSLDTNIEKVLKWNYEALPDEHKKLFLHIACFFKGEKTNNLVKYFSKWDLRRGLQVLAEKHLISIDKGARLMMHNLLEQFGIEITRKEYKYEHGRRKFLVDDLEICDMLAGNTGSGSVLDTNQSEDELSIDTHEGIFEPSTLTESEDELSIDTHGGIFDPFIMPHHVFPSFNGEDVRRSLLSHMETELTIKGIILFNANGIKMGMKISPELIRAINSSRISIVIISMNYASSTLLLDELEVIMKCREEMGQKVMTIFDGVEPSDVKKQRGYFGAVFKNTCVGKSVEDVKKWKQALEEVAQIDGYDSSNWENEADMVETVAKDVVANMLDHAIPLRYLDRLVGMDNHIRQISSLLSLDTDDVRMVGIWGPAGIGKTTIAMACYNKFLSNFTHTAFMFSQCWMRSYTDDHAHMLDLQEGLLRKTFNQKDLKIDHLGVAEKRLKDKKVLVVLDDVSDLRQLQAMAGKTQWFGGGSRIIITTRDIRLLKAHGIEQIYNVEFPCLSEALEIFCLSAFNQKSPKYGYKELTKEIIGLAGNLPLGLNVYGSYLRGMSKEEWMYALKTLRISLDGEIRNVLRREYEGLCDEDKDLFIHIACFFNGKKCSTISKYISNLDFTHGLQVLVEKSLISIDKYERLEMHNLLVMLGKEIARKEYVDVHVREDAREVCDELADDTTSSENIENRTYEGIVKPSMSSHQVFPSFCGVDVRKAFLPHMLKEFRSKGITSFIDNDIERSRPIGPELKEAIKGSKVSIVIISKNYASSTWCLDELVAIMKCREESSQIVMTVFYEVEPSDVKKQKGSFGSVFKETCVGKPREAVEKWRKALEEVAQIAGYDSSSWKNEAEMIENVAIDVGNKLSMATPSRDFDGLVGMENHIRQISSLLSLDTDDVRMVGIWGPAGIGKTTIARALYCKLSNNFTHSAFMESIRGSHENIHRDNFAFKLHLQEQLLSKTFNHKDLKIHHLGVAEERLNDKKVLVVLDDVDDLRQLQAMAGGTQWFGPGSRIIITTKDTRPLKAHGIELIYHVDFPCSSEALEIFCLSAFDQKSPKDGYKELTKEIIGLAGNLPLGLSVFGSYLRKMPKEEWIDALPRLRASLDGKIETVLMLSYDSLSDEDKDLFLHVACLFVGESISYVEKCLAHLQAEHGLKVLTEKSLISKSQEKRLMMHNLVEQLGKEIVRREHKHEPERRRFLVDSEDICDVLGDNMGTGSVLGIDLNIAAVQNELCIDKKAFKGMSHLQYLRFKSPYVYGKNNNKLILPEGLKILPRKLRVLRWDEFPLRCLPPMFRAELLLILELRNSCIVKLWEEDAPPLPHLKLMDMSYSLNLEEVPNLSNAKNLETLILNSCESLVEIPTWFKNLSSLEHLEMVGCKKLEVLPTNINLESLNHLDLSHCTQLKTFPEISTSIEYLDLEYTGVEEVPSSISSWPNLVKLSMPGYKSLRMFPDVLDSMEEELDSFSE